VPALPAPEREPAASLHLPADLESRSPEQVLGLVLEAFPGRVSLACSFQKEESVLLDMLFALEPRARVFALDTHVLFPETYALWREVEQRYGTKIEVYEGPSLGRQAAAHGDELWKSKPDLCCSIRKVAPLNAALSELDAWITGLRRDQSPTRADAPKLGWDETHELWKANPLADWSDEQCWAYIEERGLPVNPLHKRGYASIGCTHCTLPGAGREGRWADSGKVECGLHVHAVSGA
jgi:phosphoadenosine phosphosulfate reductase